MGICASSSTSKKSRVEGTNDCQDIQYENERIVRNATPHFLKPGKPLASATCGKNRHAEKRFRSDSDASSVPSNSTASSILSVQICSKDRSQVHRKETQEIQLIQNTECIIKNSHIGESPARLKPETHSSCSNQPQPSQTSGLRLSRVSQLAECSQMAAGRNSPSMSQSGYKVFLQSDAYGIMTRVPELAHSIDESSIMKKRISFIRKIGFFDEGESNKLPPAFYFKKKIM